MKKTPLENNGEAIEEQLYIYLEEVPKISADFTQQAYSTLNGLGGPSVDSRWIIGVS